VKLTEKKVVDKEEEQGESSSVIARALRITVQRVNQVWADYKSSGTIPQIGKNAGRPPGEPLSEDETEIIRETKQKYKLGARRLEPLIDRDHRIHIPHNRIHGFLLKEDLAQSNAKKQRRRRWVRYE
jgi:transposase